MTLDSIVPDDKDWTWVLDRVCPECGFDASTVAVETVGGMIRSNAARFAEMLSGDTTELAVRPEPGVWSPTEYGAHVRDVYRLFHERLESMLDTDDPLFANWDQDDTAIAERYSLQRSHEVARELVAEAQSLADAFDAVTESQWQRVGRRSDGASFTVASFARYLIHDPIHHLWDISHA